MRGFLEEIVATVQTAIDRGWSRAEAIARISFIDRYPVPLGNEAWAQAWQERNVGWTYDELVERRNQSGSLAAVP